MVEKLIALLHLIVVERLSLVNFVLLLTLKLLGLLDGHVGWRDRLVADRLAIRVHFTLEQLMQTRWEELKIMRLRQLWARRSRRFSRLLAALSQRLS